MNRTKKYDYMHKKVYEAVQESPSGRLYISTYYKRKVAMMLGMDYDTMPKIDKLLLTDSIIDENVSFEKLNK